MTHPKRADHFKTWSEMMLKQALVPERLEYKSHSKGGMRKSNKRRKRFRIRKRRKQE